MQNIYLLNIHLSSEITHQHFQSPNIQMKLNRQKKKLKAQNMLLFSTINTLLYFGSLLEKKLFYCLKFLKIYCPFQLKSFVVILLDQFVSCSVFV